MARLELYGVFKVHAIQSCFRTLPGTGPVLGCWRPPPGGRHFAGLAMALILRAVVSLRCYRGANLLLGVRLAPLPRRLPGALLITLPYPGYPGRSGLAVTTLPYLAPEVKSALSGQASSSRCALRLPGVDRLRVRYPVTRGVPLNLRGTSGVVGPTLPYRGGLRYPRSGDYPGRGAGVGPALQREPYAATLPYR